MAKPSKKSKPASIKAGSKNQKAPSFPSKFAGGGMITGTDAFVDRGNVYIEFFHIPSSTAVKFKGYVTEFSDIYAVDFNKENVYGRMDPIVTYKGTQREITLGWTVVAESEIEAAENWASVQRYVQMLYPSYKNLKFGKTLSATMLSTPPLMRMKFMNLIANARNVSLTAKPYSDKTKEGKQRMIQSIDFTDGNAQTSGLLVAPGNITIDTKISDAGALLLKNSSGGAVAIPFEIAMASTYTVLHDHDLGWRRDINKKAISKANKAFTAKVKGLTPGSKEYKYAKAKEQRAIRAATNNLKKAGDFKSFPYGIKNK